MDAKDKELSETQKEPSQVNVKTSLWGMRGNPPDYDYTGRRQ